MARKPTAIQAQNAPRRARGFASMSGLIEKNIRKAGEKRGFAVMRLLTHWKEIVGPELAELARPLKVGYTREGFGATLTVLTTGSNAPILQTQLPKIRERVNACYGYSAISRVRITQTAPDGFEEGQAIFDHKPAAQIPVSAEISAKCEQAAENVQDSDLRRALETLGQNVLTRDKKSKGKNS